MQQLASRQRGGNSALALYDDKGNVHLQVFQPQGTGVPNMLFDRVIGRVAVPRRSDGTPITPGTAPFGNAIENKVLDLLAMVTGQRFRQKRANAPGADIVNRELEAITHLLQSEVLSPAVDKIVRTGQGALRDWATQPTFKHERARRVKTLAELAARALRLLPNLSPVEIDILIGVFYGLERAAGATPDSLRQFRAGAASRLRIPVS